MGRGERGVCKPISSADRKASTPPPLNPSAATATARLHSSGPSISSLVGRRENRPTSFATEISTDAADALGLRRSQPPTYYAATRRSMASSSSVTRRKNTSPLLVSTPAEDTPHLHGDRPLPPSPAISAGRRPPPHLASSVERHRASPRPSSLSGNEDPLHRGRLTLQLQSESSRLSEDPPRPLDFSARHGHLTKALPTLKVGVFI